MSEHELWTALVCHVFVVVQSFSRHEQWRVSALKVREDNGCLDMDYGEFGLWMGFGYYEGFVWENVNLR